MSIPDYIISRTVIEEHMQRQFRDVPEQRHPQQPTPERLGRLTVARQRLSSALYAVASAIEPPPAIPECAPGHRS